MNSQRTSLIKSIFYFRLKTEYFKYYLKNTFASLIAYIYFMASNQDDLNV